MQSVHLKSGGSKGIILSVDKIALVSDTQFPSVLKDGVTVTGSQTLINNIPGMVAAKNRDLQYQACNKAFSKIAGKKHINEIIGKQDTQLYWGNTGISFQGEDQMTLLGNRLLSFGLSDYADYKRFVFKYKIPIFNSHGDINGTFFAIFECQPPLINSLSRLIDYLDLSLDFDLHAVMKKWAYSAELIPQLTMQEEKILVYVLKGLQSKEIANLMGISFRTVQVHMENIKEKFRVRNKHELIIRSSFFSDFFNENNPPFLNYYENF